MKKICWIILVLVIVFFFPKPYQSSAGFVTPEMNEAFQANMKKCAGFSVLINASAMAADAPGQSLCFGWLY